MTTRDWIAGATGALAAWLAIAALTSTSPSTEPGSLPAVSAGMPQAEAEEASQLIDLTDVDSLDRLVASEPHVFYQYIDEGGAVRFARSLIEVPEAWRDRAGRVELASPPPSSPAEARMLRKLQQPDGASH